MYSLPSVLYHVCVEGRANKNKVSLKRLKKKTITAKQKQNIVFLERLEKQSKWKIKKKALIRIKTQSAYVSMKFRG